MSWSSAVRRGERLIQTSHGAKRARESIRGALSIRVRVSWTEDRLGDATSEPAVRCAYRPPLPPRLPLPLAP